MNSPADSLEGAIEAVAAALEQVRWAEAARVLRGVDPMPTQHEFDRGKAREAITAHLAYLESVAWVPPWFEDSGTQWMDGMLPGTRTGLPLYRNTAAPAPSEVSAGDGVDPPVAEQLINEFGTPRRLLHEVEDLRKQLSEAQSERDEAVRQLLEEQDQLSIEREKNEKLIEAGWDLTGDVPAGRHSERNWRQIVNKSAHDG